MRVEQNDREMQRIAEDARNTLPGFFRHLNTAGAAHTSARTSAGESGFCVKYPFAADDDSGVDTEQVWLTNIQFKNGVYYGVLANAPRYLRGRKRGDRVIFDTGAITDWMYIRDGKIIGGYSIERLLEQIPEDQRSDEERKLLRMF